MDSQFDQLFKDIGSWCPDTYTMSRPNNPHQHFRNLLKDGDGRSELIIPIVANTYGHVISIGNTTVPLVTPALAFKQRLEWEGLVPQGSPLKIDVGGILTETSVPLDIIDGYDQPVGHRAYDVMKMYLRAVSNAHGADVDDVSKVIECIRAMTNTKWKYRRPGPMRLLIHAERRKNVDTGLRIPILERERYAVERDIAYIFREVPEAVIIICHVSAAWTIEVIRNYHRRGYQIFGEIAPQYSRYTIDDLFDDEKGGTAMNGVRFCVPCFKTEQDRQAIERAMVSGEPCFYLATDDACHTDNPSLPGGVKINNRGIIVGGQTQIPDAVISYCIEMFAQHKALHHLPGFAHDISCELFDWEPNKDNVTYVKDPYVVPDHIELRHAAGILRSMVAMRGETRQLRRLTV